MNWLWGINSLNLNDSFLWRYYKVFVTQNNAEFGEINLKMKMKKILATMELLSDA